jgi:hypothetical protein
MKRVSELVDTRINGNQIRGSKTYERMLKATTVLTIRNYAHEMGVGNIYGSKLEMIEQIKNYFTK